MDDPQLRGQAVAADRRRRRPFVAAAASAAGNREAALQRLTYVVLAARLIWPLVAAGLIVAACGSERPAASPPASEVIGTVVAGPISPVARPGTPTTRPVSRAIVEAQRGTEVVAVARTDGAGRYELRLPPGTYVILAKADRYFARTSSQTVTLSAGETRKINLLIDTGIR